MRRVFLIVSVLCSITLFAQTRLRTAEELINSEDPAWPLVQAWISKATNRVEVLPADPVKAKEALFQAQVTSRSPMGAVILSSGGILIDSGWIRILGSGSRRLSRSLPAWNKGKSFKEYGERPEFLLIADDALGGLFAINGGALGKDAGKVYYLTPDNLEWEGLGLTYTEFLYFCFNGDVNKFYEGNRWAGWKSEVAQLSGDKAYGFFPYLWTREGKDINKVSRKPIPIDELYALLLQMRRQLNIGRNGG